MATIPGNPSNMVFVDRCHIYIKYVNIIIIYIYTYYFHIIILALSDKRFHVQRSGELREAQEALDLQKKAAAHALELQQQEARTSELS